MKRETRKAILESIEHHERMKAYAMKQNPKHTAFYQDLSVNIGESIFSPDCPLCVLFSEDCTDCPLNCCSERERVWSDLYYSETWGDFVKNEIKMISILESLLKGE